jgi:hypothetical protein
MALHLDDDIAEIKTTLKKARSVRLSGKQGRQVSALLQVLELQVRTLTETAEKVKVGIEARDMTIHHLGEQLMELRSRDEKPCFMDRSSEVKRDPAATAGLYRPGKEMSSKSRESLEKDLYLQMARLSLGMGGHCALGISAEEMEKKIQEVAESLKVQAEREQLMRTKCLEVIEKGYRNKVGREKTTDFLLKKKVPLSVIEECFSEFTDSLSFDGSDEEDYSEDSTTTPSVSCHMNLKSLSNASFSKEYANLDGAYLPELPDVKSITPRLAGKSKRATFAL